MVTTNGLSTPLKLIRFMNLLKIIPNKDVPLKETVGTGDSSTTTFWLDNLGVLEDTYTLSYGATEGSVTDLTETTHYTLDMDTSKITLTGSGVTAVGTSNIYASYKYNSLEMLNSELLVILNASENKVMRDTGLTFTDTTTLAYRKIVNENLKGHYNTSDKVYDFYYQPVVKVHTTVDGAFTLGETTLTLADSSLLPSTGTIYVGGNKVTYTANSSNDLTVPATTPTIADEAIVRGEVVELSTSSEGTSPDYTVLDPDTDYEIDYANGRVRLLSSSYYSEADITIYPQNYLVRLSYLHAWHNPEGDVSIPDEIGWVVVAISARKLMGSVVAKATQAGMDDFNPALINVDQDEIKAVIEDYTTLNVGTSPYNKQNLS